MRERFGPSMAEPLLLESTGYRMTALPSAMVAEREAQSLVHALVEKVGPWLATSVLREAGHRTGDYLLAKRIPRIAQWVMRVSPRSVALAILLRAISRNAWTFVGSGNFRVASSSRALELIVESCPMCSDMHQERPMCDFYAGTFERLMQALVARHASVTETECCAQGGSVCRFEVHGIAEQGDPAQRAQRNF